MDRKDIISDFHTHTRYSHGKGLIEENVLFAKKRGLKQIGISDHGLSHVLFGLRMWKVKEARDIVDRLKGNGIDVFFGIEANLVNSNGDIDAYSKYHDYFDYVIAGYHKASLPTSFKEFFVWNSNAMFFGQSKSQSRINRFTKSYIKMIKSGAVDIVSHLNLDINVNIKEIGKAARDYGVLIELNGKRVMMPDDDILELVSMGVNFIVNSDAHRPEKVGDFSVPLDVVNRLRIPKSQIANTQMLNFNRRRK